MNAKAKAIEALEKAGCVFDSKEGSYIYYRRGDDYVIVDDHEVTFSVPLAEVPSFLHPSLSPEDQQRLEEIHGLLRGGGYARDLVGLRDLHYLLSLIDRLTGGAKE